MSSLTKISAADAKLRSEKGAILFIVAAGMVVFIGLAGLAMDLGMLYNVRTDLQNATDAESPPATPSSKPHLTARNRPACRMPLPCAAGRNGDYSACGAGSRPEPKAGTFCEHPPSLPGISARSAVFCPSRQEVHESAGS